MSRIAIVFGVLLCGLTLAALVATMQKMPSQFFPMMLGIPILFCGVVGLNPHRRRLSMLSAATIAFVGAFAGGSNALIGLYRLMEGVAVNLLGLRIVALSALICFLLLVILITFLIRPLLGQRRQQTFSTPK